MAASMPPHGPATGEVAAPDRLLAALLRTMHTDHLDWSLPAHRRGTLSGMDAAPEPTRTYLRRVPRSWAGKDPAAQSRISASWSLNRHPRKAHLRPLRGCSLAPCNRRGSAPRTSHRTLRCMHACGCGCGCVTMLR
ncbi:hypothetical protein XaCFBP7622_13005 [Xanthomonas arboricola]|nr:hypothetical protein XaCFBP7622_13005 [Xanthomonas arboricola]